MPNSPQQLVDESNRVTEMLAGKVVARVMRHRASEVVVESTDGKRFFVDRSEEGVNLSNTGGSEK